MRTDGRTHRHTYTHGWSQYLLCQKRAGNKASSCDPGLNYGRTLQHHEVGTMQYVLRSSDYAVRRRRPRRGRQGRQVRRRISSTTTHRRHRQRCQVPPNSRLVRAVGLVVEYRTRNWGLRDRLSPSPLQATLSKLLTYRVLRTADNKLVGYGSNCSIYINGHMGHGSVPHWLASNYVKCKQPYQRLNYFICTIVVIYFWIKQ